MKPSEQISAQIAHLNSAEDHSGESIADHAAELCELIPAVASFQFTEEERDTISVVFDAVLDDQTSYFQEPGSTTPEAAPGVATKLWNCWITACVSGPTTPSSVRKGIPCSRGRFKFIIA